LLSFKRKLKVAANTITWFTNWWHLLDFTKCNFTKYLVQ
jgi:hypothetical protein